MVSTTVYVKENNKIGVCANLFNRTHFKSIEFKIFCKSFQIQHITTPCITLHQTDKRSVLLTCSKGLLKNRSRMKMVAEITPNPSTKSEMSLAALVFARKIKSVISKKITKPKAKTSRNIPMNKYFYPR